MHGGPVVPPRMRALGGRHLLTVDVKELLAADMTISSPVMNPKRAARTGSFRRSDQLTSPSIRFPDTRRRNGREDTSERKSKMLASAPMRFASDSLSTLSPTIRSTDGLAWKLLAWKRPTIAASSASPSTTGRKSYPLMFRRCTAAIDSSGRHFSSLARGVAMSDTLRTTLKRLEGTGTGVAGRSFLVSFHSAFPSTGVSSR